MLQKIKENINSKVDYITIVDNNLVKVDFGYNVKEEDYWYNVISITKDKNNII